MSRAPDRTRGDLGSAWTRHLTSAAGGLMSCLLVSGPAWAVQSHGGAEGLVSHQIGHILFAIGMAYLLYRLHVMAQTGPGWCEFRVFLWLLIFWNILTFSGHWLNERVTQTQFVFAGSRTVAFTVNDLQDTVYYLSRLDHLLLVPCFVFLLLALRKWRAES